jgi:hypothetical protein
MGITFTGFRKFHFGWLPIHLTPTWSTFQWFDKVKNRIKFTFQSDFFKNILK